ncbi:hypothetical protein M0802_011798 [Mischocyttarus mexicanus]|nr:hypothetical protein M0802_011798 [Mischocyttarus mexicanus]
MFRKIIQQFIASKQVQVTDGMRQGNTLSPIECNIPFNVIMDELINEKMNSLPITKEPRRCKSAVNGHNLQTSNEVQLPRSRHYQRKKTFIKEVKAQTRKAALVSG